MYTPNEHRYDKMTYNHIGKSGLRVSAISLGLWQNFGFGSSFTNAEEMCHTAFDLGITHFDLANNYGHPYNGSAEENFGKILDRGMRAYRDELCISTKAGYDMWPGVYGDKNGCRKYLISSLDQSLKRMKLDYVDIFYHHVFDPNTPLEETALALDHIVKQGKALYVGISNYNKAQTQEIMGIFKELRTPFIVNQPSYSMLNRWIEEDGLDKWALENGIITADSMEARGFGTGRRTQMRRFRFAAADIAFLIATLGLFGITCAAVGAKSLSFEFYPSIGAKAPDILGVLGLISYGLMILMPMILELVVSLKWKYLRSAV